MNFKEWSFLNIDEKKNYIHEVIKNLEIPFEIKEFKQFEQNNIKLETCILTYKKCEFVFIPAIGNITLGWDTEINFSNDIIETYKNEWEESCDYYEGLYKSTESDYENQIKNADKTKEDVNLLIQERDELLAEYDSFINKSFNKYIQEIYAYMKTYLSPVRTVDISPMIVERKCNCKSIQGMSHSELNLGINKQNFTLPTEDEWEYLCGGGSRTFFRWGDILSTVKDEMFEMQYDKDKIIINKPNMFGLFIQPFSEIIAHDRLYKGGDGGCSLCGGDGLQYLGVSYSTFYRHIANYSSLQLPYRRLVRL